jgi:hypothetical protein
MKEEVDNHKIDWNYWKKLDSWRALEGAILLLTNYEPRLVDHEEAFVYIMQESKDLTECINTIKEIPDKRLERNRSTTKKTMEMLEETLKQLQLIQSGFDAGTLEYLNQSVTAREKQLVKPSVFIKWAIEKGLPVPEELLSLAPCQSSGNEKVPVLKITFKKTVNNKWLIGLKDNEKPYDNLDGFHYLHYLLERPNEFISATALYDLKPKHGTARNKAEQIKEEYKPSTIIPLELTDGKTIGDIKKNLEELKEEEANLQEKEDITPEDALLLKEVQKKIDGYKKYLNNTTWQGRPVTSGVSDKYRQKVQKAIIKARIKIAESDPETAEHLMHIDTGNDCKYTLDDPNVIHFDLY